MGDLLAASFLGNHARQAKHSRRRLGTFHRPTFVADNCSSIQPNARSDKKPRTYQLQEERYSALFYMPLYTSSHNSFNVLVQIANRMGQQKKICLRADSVR
jgi:hypothetical protein